jgi:chitinase
MLKRRIFLCALALLALAGCAAPRYRLVGYVVPTREFPRIDAEKLTTINFAFAHIDTQGEVALEHAGDAAFLAQLVALKARNPELKILLSIGGWGLDGFSDAALSGTSRARFADSAARLIARHSLDGVDIDWEYPTLPGPGIKYRSEDKRDFTLLLQALRARFDALAREQHRRGDDPYLITAALADREFAAGVELDRVGRVLDWINLMTYDFHGSLTAKTGHHSALTRSATAAVDERSVEAAVKQFLDSGVRRDKLVVGVPFYGKAFGDVQPANHGLDQPFAGHVPVYVWSQLAADFIDRNGYVRYWDAQAQQPYLWNEAKREFVTYDDPQSLSRKAEYVKAQRLGGIMYWEQSNDPDGTLFNTLAHTLLR